ncbi:amidohydrolase family protein [Paenibacillus periandrae]|uniref:amidohydrolase family protein n=1 Tax=Paenibacillus periandrae TaxID=1761741 RepID=UPI001F08F794|nr:amidohydrolase family protein [Paenibacillus periandrae]
METTQIKGSESKSKLKRSIIDTDIHGRAPREGMLKYMPRIYREQIATFGWRLPAQGGMFLNGGTNGSMQDVNIPEDSENEDTYLDYLRKNHLDTYNIEYGILTGGGYEVHAAVDTDFAAAVCSAHNDYYLERYLSRESRLKGSILIPKQDPILSAKEIDRVGSNPDMIQVVVSNGAQKPYGHRFYHPIYEACVRHNLPFTIHVSMEGIGINNPTTGAGHVTSYIEYRAARAHIMAAHMASFIFEGVFEKFPTLKVVMMEAGMLWIAPLIWRLDQDWKALRHQTPWVKEPPSEYYRKFFRVTSQPLELPPTTDMIKPMMNAIHCETNLMFASDFPHWDFDSPTHAFPKLDENMWDRIFYQNAAELYGLPQRKASKGVALA